MCNVRVWLPGCVRDGAAAVRAADGAVGAGGHPARRGGRHSLLPDPRLLQTRPHTGNLFSFYFFIYLFFF